MQSYCRSTRRDIYCAEISRNNCWRSSLVKLRNKPLRWLSPSSCTDTERSNALLINIRKSNQKVYGTTDIFNSACWIFQIAWISLTFALMRGIIYFSIIKLKLKNMLLIAISICPFKNLESSIYLSLLM